MTLKRRKFLLIFGFGAVLLAAILAIVWQVQNSRATLWRIVSASCIPAAQSGATGRCAEVSISKGTDPGYVVFKDRNGPLQYLLMPTKRVTGIEDPFLLSAEAPAYWAEAWRAKRWMDIANGKPVPREAVSITINSAWGRSQNQLHLHVSCVRSDLRSFLSSIPASRNDAWTPIPGGWMGHPYEVRRLVADTMAGQDLFKDVAREHAGDMGQQAIAVIATQIDGKNGFWLLRTHMDLSALWIGAIDGDVQDHSCSEVRHPA
jgi:CDP-diacylglycerol pyrophosphatase